MLDRRGIGEVQKSQEEFGLEPFRNPVSFWQSWPRTWGWGGGGGEQQKHPGPGLAQSVQNNSGHFSPELPQHSQLCS